MDTTQLLADAQKVVTDIEALAIPTPPTNPVTTIVVTFTDGSTQTFIPQQ